MRRMDRREFVGGVTTGAAAAFLTGCSPSDTDSSSLGSGQTGIPPLPEEGRGYVDPDPLQSFHATGKTFAIATTSKEATEAAVSALEVGGNAADAYIAAALTQAVVEVGLISIGGAFGINFFNAATGETGTASGRLGPAAAEPYDFDRLDPVTLTGRAMPVPGYVAGVFAAHAEFGRLGWSQLFEKAVRCARGGVAASNRIVSAANESPRATRFPEGQAIWMREGRYLRPGERLEQEAIGRTLEAIAEHGPEAFYEGEFAKRYVARAQADGGLLTLEDMATWREMIRIRRGSPEGNYRGYKVWAPGAGLITYGLHLSEAADLRSTGPAISSAETVDHEMRIIDEVFLSTSDYSEETHERFVSPEYAQERIDAVIRGPRRQVDLDALFNTSFVAIQDSEGNCAWGTHSINTPLAFGSGIVVEGVYAAYAISRNHVHGTGATANGIGTGFALFRDGRPRLLIGSPGFGFVHGPYQAGVGIVEWGLSLMEALKAPRFGFPNANTFGQPHLEGHYQEEVYRDLETRGVPFFRATASTSTGLVGALLTEDDGTLRVAQDPRREGYAAAG